MMGVDDGKRAFLMAYVVSAAQGSKGDNAFVSDCINQASRAYEEILKRCRNVEGERS